jgi:hypothetical protein
LSGKPFDWNGDGKLTAADAATDMGEGIPKAPNVSAGVGGGTVTPTLVGGSSDGDTKSISMEGLNTELAVELLRIDITPEMHEVLHKGTSP